MGQVQIKKVSWWHEAITDWMILNPSESLGNCAKFFKVTQPWLSTIINSDMFRDFFKLRMAEHHAMASQTVVDKINGLTDLSLDVLAERIEKERETIGLGIVRETAQMALKAAGYINRVQPPSTNVNVTVGLVEPEVLARAREKMRLRVVQEGEPERLALPSHSQSPQLPVPEEPLLENGSLAPAPLSTASG